MEALKKHASVLVQAAKPAFVTNLLTVAGKCHVEASTHSSAPQVELERDPVLDLLVEVFLGLLQVAYMLLLLREGWW